MPSEYQNFALSAMSSVVKLMIKYLRVKALALLQFLI